MRVSFLFLFLLGCSEPQSAQTPSSETNAGETVAPDPNAELPTAESEEPPPSVPSVVPDPCAELRAETNTILREPAVACSSDEECTCYPAFIDCGGVRDSATAQRLIEVNERRIAADCDYIDFRGNAFNCAPWECVPQCSAGVCAPRLN